MDRIVYPAEFIPTTYYTYTMPVTTGQQLLDTRVPDTTTGPVVHSASFVGRYRYTFQSTINTTTCNIGPATSNLLERYINVITCKPTWRDVGAPAYEVTPHLPTGNIQIYINPAMWDQLGGPATAAADLWSGAMAQAGIPLTVTAGNYPCVEGPSCVNVSETYVDVDGCAGIIDQGIAWDSNGVFNQGMWIDLRPTWRSASAARLQRTMAHEIGHLLGLHHNSCSDGDSVMKAPATSCTELQAMTNVPTPNDALPTTSSTYGNRNQKLCGFTP